jgi:hypothetical protein
MCGTRIPCLLKMDGQLTAKYSFRVRWIKLTHTLKLHLSLELSLHKPHRLIFFEPEILFQNYLSQSLSLY